MWVFLKCFHKHSQKCFLTYRRVLLDVLNHRDWVLTSCEGMSKIYLLGFRQLSLKFATLMWLRLLYYRFVTRLFLNGKIAFKKLMIKQSEYVC